MARELAQQSESRQRVHRDLETYVLDVRIDESSRPCSAVLHNRAALRAARGRMLQLQQAETIRDLVAHFDN